MLWRCIKDYYHDQIIFKLFFDKTTCFGLLYTTQKGVSRSQPLNNMVMCTYLFSNVSI